MTARRRSPRGHPGSDGENDRIVATYREHGQALVRGVPMTTVMAEMYGKAEGCSGGRGGSMHLFDAPRPISMAAMPLSAAACRWPVAWRWPTRCGRGWRHGLLLRRRRRGRGRVPRDAEPRRAVGPAGLFVCENNGYAMGTAIGRTNPRPTSAPRRPPTASPPKSSTAWTWSPSRPPPAAPSPAIRETGRPYFLECNTYRFRAHSMFDAQLYRDKDRGREVARKGPIVRFQGWLLENHLIQDSDIARSRPRRCRDRRGRGLCRGRHLGAGGDADPPCPRKSRRRSSPGHALGQRRSR
jgi:2-oxoisovalerate dehydrogenase E1 component